MSSPASIGISVAWAECRLQSGRPMGSSGDGSSHADDLTAGCDSLPSVCMSVCTCAVLCLTVSVCVA